MNKSIIVALAIAAIALGMIASTAIIMTTTANQAFAVGGKKGDDNGNHYGQLKKCDPLCIPK